MAIAKFCLTILITGIFAGCATPIDLAAEQKSLLEADRRFDQLSGEKGPANAFATFLVEDSLSLPRNGPAVSGVENIAKSLAGDYTLRWTPQDGTVSGDATMGYTWGTWLLSVDTESGVVERRGKYLNVWVKRNSQWKVLVDIGNQADSLPE